MEQIAPIDFFVFEEFQSRFQQVFNCSKCAFINTHDKTAQLQKLFGKGKPLTYPYAYFEVKKISENIDSYNPHQMMRRGMVLNVNSGSTIQTVRVLPTDYEIDITYVTNRFQSVEQGSVIAFSRRWLMARRLGWLKGSIDYGRMQFGIGITMDSSISTPSLGNIVEAETAFAVSVSATVHGYTSEPVLGEQGKINTINVIDLENMVKAPGTVTDSGVVASSQFLAFPK
ncbi:hypothetical protein ROB59_000276 [Staphylococcus aureus]|jgi:hypothetical protein|uniref:hypothetical protein n=18 Tax=Bacteria TaxID=2 RepID=UPI002050FB03